MRMVKRLAMVLALIILSSINGYAWTQGLEAAARAVSSLKGATPAQKMLVFLNNKELNLMAQEGKITDYVYASCEDIFFQLNDKFIKQAVERAGFEHNIREHKYNPGTDTDVNINARGEAKLALEDIEKVENNYQEIVRQYFREKGLSPPSGKIDTETDFMPNPDNTSPEEFKKCVDHINQNGGTAYKDPDAARAQAKLDGKEPVSIEEASSYDSCMKDMAKKKIREATRLREQADFIRSSDPGQAEMLDAEARLSDYQTSKYLDRINRVNNSLRDKYGLPSTAEEDEDLARAIEHIKSRGRGPITHGDAEVIHEQAQEALRVADDETIDTLLEIATHHPAEAERIQAALARKVSTLPADRSEAAIKKIESAMKEIDSGFAKSVSDEAKSLARAEAGMRGAEGVSRVSVAMTAGMAVLMAYEGITVTLDNVKATDTLWDYFRNCYYHAAWEGTGIGPAFDQAQKEEIERYLKEYESGHDPSMMKHITLTLLKTGTYLGKNVIIGVLYLPDTVWEYFTEEKAQEGYAKMHNQLAAVMHQMVLDRKDFDKLMSDMKKRGLHEEDYKRFLDCMCSDCGGSMGGFYRPDFQSDAGHGPCQCNGPLSIWKTPLPVNDTKRQYQCFNEVTKVRYEEAQAVFNKWHQQMVEENAKSVQADLNDIKDRIKNSEMAGEDGAREIADRFNGIKELLLPQDADFVRAMVGPYLENHAHQAVQKGQISRAIEDLNTDMKKLGARNVQDNSRLKQLRSRFQAWDKQWTQVKKELFPKIDDAIADGQVQAAKWQLENLEYRMRKDPSRSLPPATEDPDFLALKEKVAALQKAQDETGAQAHNTGPGAGKTNQQTGTETPPPSPSSTASNSRGRGHWKLMRIEGNLGRECASNEVYNDYYRDTIRGKEGDIIIGNMIRKSKHVYFSAEGTWKRPPEVMYPDSVIEIPLSITKLSEDTSQYWGKMSIDLDLDDMKCGATSGGGDIGELRIDHKMGKSVHKTIRWKVKEPFQKEPGEKLTIRTCYTGASICDDHGWRYYYAWVPGTETSPQAQEGNGRSGGEGTGNGAAPGNGVNSPIPGTRVVSGNNKSSTCYSPNTRGDVYNGGHWAGASGGSDWLEKDFEAPLMVSGVSMGEASTDVTTQGFKLVLKLKKTDGQWLTVDELHDTNINRTALSGGAIGKSIPSYSKRFSPAIEAVAFRLEFSGHGWFDATDLRIYKASSDGGTSSDSKPRQKSAGMTDKDVNSTTWTPAF